MVCFLCKKTVSMLFGNNEDPGRDICLKCVNTKDTHSTLYPECQQDWHDSHDRHLPTGDGLDRFNRK